MGILERILDILLRIEKHITGNNKEIQKTESAAEITKTTGKLNMIHLKSRKNIRIIGLQCVYIY